MGNAGRGMESSGLSSCAMARSAGFISLPWGACLKAGLGNHHLETPFSTVLECSMIKIKLNLPIILTQLEYLQEKDKH